MAKLRITLFEDDNSIKSDRLVEQALEFSQGPKEAHSGPIRLELNLLSKDDVEQAVEYLKKLSGDLPLSQKAEKKLAPKKVLTEMGIEPLKDLLDISITKNKTQEQLIEYLRPFGFVFVSYQTLCDINQANNYPWELKKPQHERYQFFIRRLKLAKDPKSDKYDGQLVYGIKIYGKKVPKVIVYLFGKYKKTVKLEWADEKGINFKKVDKVYRFPDMMDYNERLRWRKELRIVEKDPNYEPSKFFLKWKPYIKVNK